MTTVSTLKSPKRVNLFNSSSHQVHIYLEYHSVCPLVRIGTPHPLSRKRECYLPDPTGGGGTYSPAGEGAGGPNSDEWRKSLVLMIVLLCLPYISSLRKLCDNEKSRAARFSSMFCPAAGLNKKRARWPSKMHACWLFCTGLHEDKMPGNHAEKWKSLYDVRACGNECCEILLTATNLPRFPPPPPPVSPHQNVLEGAYSSPLRYVEGGGGGFSTTGNALYICLKKLYVLQQLVDQLVCKYRKGERRTNNSYLGK
jgi:hypothetical protein